MEQSTTCKHQHAINEVQESQGQEVKYPTKWVSPEDVQLDSMSTAVDRVGLIVRWACEEKKCIIFLGRK